MDPRAGREERWRERLDRNRTFTFLFRSSYGVAVFASFGTFLAEVFVELITTEHSPLWLLWSLGLAIIVGIVTLLIERRRGAERT